MGGAAGVAGTTMSAGSGGMSSEAASGIGGGMAMSSKPGKKGCSVAHVGAAARSSLVGLLLGLAIVSLRLLSRGTRRVGR
jgi:hypothetical protein